ncbi:MAG: hypothetical protein IKY01_01030 [Prevotella sp.]|nr:hypothetical protein [Prevotella sp.]
MKKTILLLLLLAVVSISASARKSYITVHTYNLDGNAYESGLRISGDMPENIEGFDYSSGSHLWYLNYNVRSYSIGEILNVLSEYGYEVEFVNTSSNGCLSYLLSKETSSGQTVSEGDVNKDGEVNIADINKIVSIILGIIKENPSILEQIKD